MKVFLRFSLFVMCAAFSLPSRALEKPDSIAFARTLSRAYRLFLSYPDSSIDLANDVLTKTVEERHPYLQAYSYYVLAKANWAKANYRLSTEFGFKALKILENSPYPHVQGEVFLSLARTFIDLHDYDQAYSFIAKAHQLSQVHADSLLQADAFREKSMLLSETKQYDSALLFADLGISYYQKHNDSLNLSILFGRKSKIHFLLGEYSKSTSYNRRALVLDSLVGNIRALGISYFYAAQNAYQLHKTDSAIWLLKRAIAINQRIPNLPALVKAHTLLSEIYEQNNKTSTALDHMHLVQVYKDSLYNTERNGRIQEMQLLYELERKDKTIEQLGQENISRQQEVRNQRVLMIVLGIGVALLGIVILLLTRLRSIQEKANDALAAQNKAIEQQKEEIQSQAEFLQKLNNLKSKLFSVISHDVRGPIANLQSLLDLLTAKIMTPQEFMAVSDKLKTNLNITQRTLENLLNWSLSQMEGLKTEPKTIDIKSALDEACNLMEEFAQRKQVSIENNTPDSIAVLADPNQLQLILRNLIHNAIKFSKANGMVAVSAHHYNGVCMVRIKDFGIGLTSEEKARLLNAQEHFTKTGTQQEKGTGLGFLLCQEFVTRNGGTLEIDSEPGQGTEVSFTLQR